MKKELKKLWKRAWDYFNEFHSNYVPDEDDIAEFVAQEIEDEVGYSLTDEEWEKLKRDLQE